MQSNFRKKFFFYCINYTRVNDDKKFSWSKVQIQIIQVKKSQNFDESFSQKPIYRESITTKPWSKFINCERDHDRNIFRWCHTRQNESLLYVTVVKLLIRLHNESWRWAARNINRYPSSSINLILVAAHLKKHHQITLEGSSKKSTADKHSK